MKKILITPVFVFTLFSIAFSQITDLESQWRVPAQIDIDQAWTQAKTRTQNHRIPIGNNQEIVAELIPNSAIGAGLKKEMKDIETYDVRFQGRFIGTYTLTKYGVWYYLIFDDKQIAIYPEHPDGSSNHVIEFGNRSVEKSICAHQEVYEGAGPGELTKMTPEAQRGLRSTFGEDIREYRMVIVTTGEFFQLNGGGLGPVEAVIASSIQGLTALYLNELSVRFILEDRRLYNNPNTDPFDPPTGNRPIQAGAAVAMNFPPTRYDIGHALHKSAPNDGWESGGVARLNAVCKDQISQGSPLKAQGWSGSFNNSGFAWISLFGHEVGHMFGAEHTFNGIGESCTDAISETTAYEIGSGTTIMSYNGICDPDQNIPSSGAADNYFHVNSLMQMMAHIVGVGDCAAKTASNNNAPVVNTNPCGANFVFPKNTPFYIEGFATDPDGHEITYCWEQFDEDGPGTPTQGMIGTQASTRISAPLFRSYPPTSVPYRYFPRPEVVLAGNSSDEFDVLPALGRNVNMKLTVRDNQPTGGSVTIEDQLIVSSPTGPLIVNNVLGGGWTTGDNVNITWAPNGSEALCDKVSIHLSVDGGLTYPFLIAEDVDYAAGSYNITVPGLYPTTLDGRIKVKCTDFECFYFYDITNTKFRINSICDAPESFVCPAMDRMFDAGDPELDLADQTILIGQSMGQVTKTVSFSSSTVDVATFNQAGTACHVVTDNYVGEYYTFKVDETGTYTFTIDPDFDGFGFVSVFEDATFSNTNPCPSFVSSSGFWSGNGTSVSARTTMVAELEACKAYRMVFYNYNPNPPSMTRITGVSGPGYAIEEAIAPDPDFSSAYVVVDNETNLIVFVSDTPNFTGLIGGNYTVHAMAYKTGGATPPNITDLNNYVGQTFNSFYIDGDCLLASVNSFQLIIEGSCSLTNVELGNTAACNPIDNSFIQELIVSYDVTPGMGEIMVAGQSFPITVSPQTIAVILESNGGVYSGEVFFTAEPNCKLSFEVMERENCCPFVLDLPDTVGVCAGLMASIDAGAGGTGGSYEWYDASGNLLPETGAVLTTDTEGQFSVIVTNSTGCSRMDTTFVDVIEVPTIQLSPDVTICDGAFTLITAQTNAPTVQWFLDGNLVQDGPDKELSLNVGGTVEAVAFFDSMCPVTAQMTVSAIESPRPDLGPDIFLCEGESITLDGTANGTVYTWFKDGVLLMETSSMLTVDATGTYRVNVRNADDCLGTDEVDVLVEGIPTLTVSDDVTICDGEATNLIATTDASLIKWFLNGDLVKSGSEKNLIVSTGGTVLVQAGNSEDCSVEETIIVTANVSPKPNLGRDSSFCEGDEYILNANASGVAYVWYQNGVQLPDMGQSLTVNSSGLYRLEVTNAGDCTGTDVANISFLPYPVVDAGSDVSFCEGTSVVVSGSSDSPFYIWYKDGAEYPAIDLSFTTTQAGTYVLEGTNAAECITRDTVIVTEIAKPPVDLGMDRLACIGDEVDLSGPDGTYNYTWFRNGTQVSTSKDLVVTDNGLYVLIVTDSNNCSAEDDVMITFEPGPTITINEVDVDLCEGEVFTAVITTNAPSIQWLKDGVEIQGATGLTLDISQSGTYTAQAEGNSGCLVQEEIVVRVNPVPAVDLDASYSACMGETITLNSNVMGQSYSWEFNNAVVSTMQSLDVTQAGVYTLTVVNNFDCSNSDMTTVSFIQLPNVTLDDSDEFCEGDDLTITATSNGSVFQWYKDGQIVPGANRLTLTVNSGGQYSLEATGTGNCKNSETIDIVEVAAPTVNLGMDVTLCPGEMVTLDAGTQTGSTILWSSGETTQTISVTNDSVSTKSTTSFMVTVENASGCITQESVSVTFLPVIDARISSSANGVCTGDSLLLTASGGETFNWSGPPGSFELVTAASIRVFPSTSATYSVVVSDQCPGNEDSATKAVEVFIPAEVNAGNDTCALLGRTIELMASGGRSYAWEDDVSFESSLFTATPTIRPTVETTYTVTITDSNGCVQTDQVTVCIIEDPLSIFKAVTAITPNGDGLNDELSFPGLEAFEENRLIIFNRWGNIVYEKIGYQSDDRLFNGTRNGEPLPPDTYYYILTFDEFTIKESLTIIRPE